jgi:hypothetical protein
MVKIYKFYEKELLWKMFGSSMGALAFALIYFSLERSILKTLTGIVSSFWIVILFSTLVSFVILMIAVRNQKSSLYYEFIIEQKLIPRLIHKKQREKDKIKKAKYGIMIEYLGLGISSNEKDKLEAEKRINEIKLSSIPCSEKKKLKLKKEIKEIEIELTEDASEKIKLSEEIEALEELLLQ